MLSTKSIDNNWGRIHFPPPLFLHKQEILSFSRKISKLLHRCTPFLSINIELILGKADKARSKEKDK